MVRTFEIFTDKYSVIKQAETMLDALIAFDGENRPDKVLFAEDVDARKQERESQNSSTSDEALPIGDVVGRSEQFICYKQDFEDKPKCDNQCFKCREYECRSK